MAGLAAGASRAFEGSGALATDVAYRIITRLHFVRFMFHSAMNKSMAARYRRPEYALIWILKVRGIEQASLERIAAGLFPQAQMRKFWIGLTP
ncbi:hypothetical protein HJB89_03265 [Rhizobium sp. NZLR8]|uniref:hypothetical protein n=1 Tax=Rhizobium sp. NZLR8 TaxID=2731104 RepID=UPI001C835473|nr:hypothetical protein [Rhizobium sp. NZLR8]MBX5156162.1 hypothetical protein [Rhizobium sp. NZLR8]